MNNIIVNIAGLPGQRLSGVLHRHDRSDFDFLTRHTLVIMLHGYPGDKNSHDGIFEKIAKQISRDKIDTLRFDFTGCGESSGAPEDFTLHSAQSDLKLAITWARKRGYKRFFFLGEGLGALIGLMNAQTDGLRGLIMLWPYLDLKETALSEMLPYLDDPACQEKQLIDLNGQITGLSFLRQIQSFDVIPHIEDITVPILIQQGEADDKAPAAQLDLIRDHAVNAKRIELTNYENGQHGLPGPNIRRTVFYHIRQFVQRYL